MVWKHSKTIHCCLIGDGLWLWARHFLVSTIQKPKKRMFVTQKMEVNRPRLRIKWRLEVLGWFGLWGDTSNDHISVSCGPMAQWPLDHSYVCSQWLRKNLEIGKVLYASCPICIALPCRTTGYHGRWSWNFPEICPVLGTCGNFPRETDGPLIFRWNGDWKSVRLTKKRSTNKNHRCTSSWG